MVSDLSIAVYLALGVEMVNYLRVKNEAMAKSDGKNHGADRRKALHAFYYALPKSTQFSAIKLVDFAECPEHSHAEKRQKMSTAAQQAEKDALARVAFGSSPPE